jgi:hypothetical protein
MPRGLRRYIGNVFPGPPPGTYILSAAGIVDVHDQQQAGYRGEARMAGREDTEGTTGSVL